MNYLILYLEYIFSMEKDHIEWHAECQYQEHGQIDYPDEVVVDIQKHGNGLAQEWSLF